MNEDITHTELLDKVTLIVKQASLLLKEPIIRISDAQNPSTNVDVEVSDFLSDSLRKALDVDLLSEDALTKESIFNKQCWIIDPIDGTMNFISGSPDVAISVALVDADLNAILSVVFLPYFDELYTASRGYGAKLNGKRLSTSSTGLNIISFGLSGNADKKVKSITLDIGRIISNGFVLRQSGSAAVDICRVAKGMWRGFFEKGLYIWDVVAADGIAREAGSVSDMAVNHENYECDYILSNSKVLHEKLKTLLSWSR